ncbi:MAG: ABC transporter ATP-binding protein, partial [Ruminococcus sp.]|nr:ABC transporter ATP-binding protein [Ruminococcus sp.]
MAILSVESLSFKYPLCEEPAVRDISFELAEGEILLVCGAGGSGKSTLLHCLKREVIPNGELSGRVIIDGRDTAALGVRESACLAGFVTQDCEQQIVTDKVWHELAFGLENLGLGRDEIAVRVAEAAAYFGLNDKLHRDTATLSGGEKQMLAL